MVDAAVPTKIKLSVADSGNTTDPNFLPETFEVFTTKDFVNKKECEMCERTFGFTTSKHHCRRCNMCVCEDCSKSRRQLSRSDKNFYRVCDYCDKKMQYAKVEKAFKDVEENRAKLIDMYKQRIKELQEKKQVRASRMAFLEKKFAEIAGQFNAEEELLAKKLAREEQRTKECSDMKKIDHGRLKMNLDMLQKSEQRLKETEKERDTKRLECEDLMAEIKSDEAKVAKYRDQVQMLEDRLKNLTGVSHVELKEDPEMKKDTFIDDPDFAGYVQPEQVHVPEEEEEGNKQRPKRQKQKLRVGEEKACCVIF